MSRVPGAPPMPSGELDLFVGQLIALLPKLTATAAADPVVRHHVGRLFPRTVEGIEVVDKLPRPRTYSLFLNSNGGGTLTIGGIEIPVAVMPLDVATPLEATAFTVTAIAGRSLRVSGIAEGAAPR